MLQTNKDYVKNKRAQDFVKIESGTGKVCGRGVGVGVGVGVGNRWAGVGVAVMCLCVGGGYNNFHNSIRPRART